MSDGTGIEQGDNGASAAPETESGEASEHASEHASDDTSEDMPPNDMSPDGRRGPIVLKVEYKRLNTFFYDYTKNISKGGTFIKTDRPLDVGTKFQFQLTVPVSNEPIELRGEVRWVVRPGEASAPDGGPGSIPNQEPGMGIRFVYDDPEERVRLERTVEQIMVSSLGQVAYARLFRGPDSDP